MLNSFHSILSGKRPFPFTTCESFAVEGSPDSEKIIWPYFLTEGPTRERYALHCPLYAQFDPKLQFSILAIFSKSMNNHLK
jgi:hypothetical protein